MKRQIIFAQSAVWQVLRRGLMMSLAFSLTGCGVVNSWLNGIGKSSDGLSSNLSTYSISFRQTNIPLTEGGTAQLVILLSEAQTFDVPVQLAFISSNGDEATRFQPIANPVVIPAGQVAQFFTLSTIEDDIYEGTETYTLGMTSSSPSAQITNSPMTIVLSDNESPPQVNFTAATQTIIETAGASSATVQLSEASTQAISVAYSFADGTATLGTNYQGTAGTITFAPLQTTATIPFTMIHNPDVTGNLNFTINLGELTGVASIGSIATQTITDVDAESANLVINNVSVNDGSTATFTITSSMASSTNQTVHYQTVDGTAVAGTDYTTTSGTATITAGQTSTTVTVPTTAVSTICAANKIFTVHLSNPTNAAITTADGTGTIQNTNVPSLSIANGSAAEGNSVGITATLSAACATQAVTFTWSNSALTARAGVDYTIVTNQNATIAAGQTTTTLSTPTVANHYNLGVTKTFQVAISSPTSATLGTSTAIGTITQTNTPPSTPTLTLSDPNTGLTTYARQTTVNVAIGNDSTAVQWCLSETQTSKPALGTSTCTGGTGSNNGWLTALPTTFTLSSGNALKTVYLWTSDIDNNVSATAVTATITLDIETPAKPTVALSDPDTGSTTNTDQSTVTLTISGDTNAAKWCVFEQAVSVSAPSAPLYSNACWVSSRPTTQALGATGTREVYVYTMDVADNVSAAAATATIMYSTTVPSNPTLTLSDPTTGSTLYARQTTVDTTINNDGTAVKWCLSETQTTAPALGTSTCTGGQGTSNGWSVILPTTFTLSSTNGLQTVYLWVADAYDNVDQGPVTATIDLDTTPPSTPTVTLSDPNTGSTTLTSSSPANLTITGDTGATSWCVFEQAAAASAPSAPLYNNACWVSSRPTTKAMGALGNRTVYVYTMNVADDVSAAAATASIDYSNTPTITSIAPNNGSAAGGTSITITGTAFLSGVTVTVGGSTCTSPALTGSTQIVCTTPAGSVGAADVVVTNTLAAQPTGTRTVTSTGGYTYNALPTISVNSVSGNEGTSLTFTASLSATTDVPVTFSWATSNGTAVAPTNYTSGSGSGLTIAAGSLTQTFSVTTVDDGVATSDLTFTVALSSVTAATYTTGGTGTIDNVDAPTISGVSPSSGTNGGGQSVTITGTGFLSGATVTIGGATCTSPTITGTTQIICTTPAGTAGAANVVVTNSSSVQQHGTLSATDVGGYTFESISLRAAGTPLSQKITTPSTTLSAPAGLQAGDVEIAQVWTKNSTSAATISPPTGWTAIRNDQLVDGTKYSAQYLFYKVATSSEPSTYTYITSVPSSHAGGEIIAYSGVNNSTPVDTASCSTGVQTAQYGGSATAPSITTTETNEKVLFLAAATDGAFPAPPVANQFTQEMSYIDTYVGNYIFDKSLSSAGATPALNFYVGGYNTYFICQMALAPTSGSISIVGSTTSTHNDGTNCTSNSGTGCNFSVSAPSGLAPGDVEIAQVTVGSGTGAYPSYSFPGWTQIRLDQYYESTGPTYWEQYLLYKVAGSSEPSSYSFTQPSNNTNYNVAWTASITAYSGVNTTTPIDVSACNSGYPAAVGATITAPSITTTNANDRLMLIYAIANGAQYGFIDVLSNFTQEWYDSDTTNTQGIYGADRLMSTAGATGSASVQVGYYNDWFACQISLIP